jgi:hypothetical protein
MLVEAGEVGTYTAQGAITKAIDLDLDAVKIVEAGSESRTVKEATEGATRYAVVGAIESIGPPQTSQVNVADGETVGVRKKKIVRLIVKGGSGAIGFKQPLACAGSGKVKGLTLTASPEPGEELLAIAVAEEAVDASDEDQAILAELKVL